MRQRRVWAAAFDGARCRVFELAGAPPKLAELTALRLSGARKPEFDDRPGAVFSSASTHRSAMTPPTDPERKLEDAFIGEVVDHLYAQSLQKAFDRLIAAASPRALGTFRATAPKALMSVVVRVAGSGLGCARVTG